MMLRLLALACLAITAVVGQDCGGDWIKYNDMCYLVQTQRQFWGEGRKACQAMNGDLAVANTPQIHDFLSNLLKDTDVRYWIGLHDTSMEGNFVWVDGSPLTTTYWNPGEPNNYGDYDEDCVEFEPGSGKWWDENCIEPQFYICGRSINQLIKCDESAGWREYNGKCYFYSNDRKTFEDAEYYCNLIEGNLVAVNSQDEQDYLQSYQITVELNYWIGLTDKDSGSTFPGDFVWTDGSPYGVTSFTNWDSGEPDFVDQKNCVGVERLQGGKWSVSTCGETKTFFCERLEGTCPDGWRQHDGQCYQFNVNNPMTWTDAKHYCEAQGTYLTTILSDAENQFITSKLPGMRDAGITDVYIGISDVANDGQFSWTAGNVVQYSNWNEGMPFNTVDQSDCGSMFTGDLSGKWDTKTCFNLQAFVCKVQVGRQVNEVPPDTVIGSCPSGWTIFGDSCYYISLDDSSTWTGAQASCEQMDSNLVSIHGADEQSFLSNRANILGENLWIGLHDTLGEGNFEWTDTSPLDFTNWGRGQPDNHDTGEDCVHLEGAYHLAGNWNDLPCDNQHRYICKKIKTDDGTINTPMPVPTGIYNDKCGPGWEYDNMGNCYAFRFNDYKFWEDAKLQCRLEGGDLTSVNGFEEQNFLTSRTMYTNEGALWFGANDLSAEGGWDWSDGTPFRFLNWNDGEPNNAHDEGEHCGEWYTATGKWNDISCRREVGYICKQGRALTKGFYPHRLRKYADSSVYVFQLGPTYPEACADLCRVSTDFCLGFDYFRNIETCKFSTVSMTTSPLVPSTESEGVDHYELDPEAGEDMPATTANPSYGCPKNWRGYGGYCYHINAGLGEYAEARTLCTTAGSDLASIHTLNENNFIMSYSHEIAPEVERAWIGMNDLDQEMLFSWVDGSDVEYVNWAYYEPNNSGEEDCVEMYINDGRWNDVPCTGYNFNSVCKTKKYAGGEMPSQDGCPEGWVAYMSSCYWFNQEQQSWSNANEACIGVGAHLVVLNDKYENGFIGAQLGVQASSPMNFWTGLNDIARPGSYEWVDGAPITFTNWATGQPTDFFGAACVVADAGVPRAGYWLNFLCDDQHAFVCEKQRDGYATQSPINPGKTNPSNINCAAGWIGYGSGCFRIFETDDNNLRKTWEGARSYCMAAGGDLASYHSVEEEAYIRDSYDAVDPDNAFGYWIGLNDRANEGGYEWSDATPVEYTNWERGEPNDSGGTEECVESFLNPGRGWNDLECSAPRHWVCRIPKGVVPASPSPVSAEQCPDNDPNWTYRHPYCYYISPATDAYRKTWTQADDWCQDNAGYLVSIHDDTEMAYLRSMVVPVVSSYWIGLREYSQNGQLVWSDGSPLDYTNWNPGEPNDSNGEEQCAEMETFDDGRWNDNACGIRNAFMCKRAYDNNAPITRLPTPAPYGGCPTGWYKLLNKCYKIFGIEHTDRRNWADARDMCKATQGSNLATIHSQAQQSALAAIMKSVPEGDVWIGLSDTGSQGKFHWTDESDLDYTNWAVRQPDGSVLFPQPGSVDCVEMMNDADHPGKWNDVECKTTMNAYLCQLPLNPSLPDNPPTLNVCTSETYTAYFDTCFRVSSTPATFSVAQSTCKSEGGYLSSVVDGYDEAFIETQLYMMNLPGAWLGMSDDGSGQYKWLDGWPVYYTNWGENEPSMRENEGCVMVDAADAAWEDTTCEMSMPYVCKISTAEIPKTPAPPKGYCPEGWMAFHTNCYLFDFADDTRISWGDAKGVCQLNGGQLVSIHSSAENKFLQTNAVTGAWGVASIWIGLNRNDAGGWEWDDGSPVDYVYWENGEPNGQERGENCAEMYDERYGKWNDEDCFAGAGYICQMKQLPYPDGQEPEKQTGGVSAGAVVGILIAIIIVIAAAVVLAWFMMSRNTSSKNLDPAPSTTTPSASGFDNVLYAERTDDKAQIVADA